MARKVKDKALDSREARSKLKASGKPYYRIVEEGAHLGYRRLKGRAGTWCARYYAGKQQYEVEGIGTADDLSDADGVAILTYWQAFEKVRERRKARAHGTADDGPAPSVRTAVENYIAERDAREAKRNGRPIRSDAHRLARYVIGREAYGNRMAIDSTKLADLPLSALDDENLQEWRDALPADMKEASKRRTINDLKAALNAGYEKHRKKHKLDPALPAIIRRGLTVTANGNDDDNQANVARDNQILTDAQITRLLQAAKEVDAEEGWDGDLYRMVAVLAATGARYSQLIRMRVSDCLVSERRLMVPWSRKGKKKQRGATKVPVGQDVIEALLPAVTGRARNAPLLERWRHKQVAGGKWERAERGPWQRSEMDRPWELIRERAKMPEVIAYAFRHSSIVRSLKTLPTRLVAALHDTSVVMIERHYAKWIADGLDELAARAVVPLLPREDGAKIVQMRRSKAARKPAASQARQ